MNTGTLKSTLIAASVALSFLAAPSAIAEGVTPSRNTGVSQMIAIQGNAALRAIQAEFKAALRPHLPALPARAKRVSAPAAALPAAAGALAATAACAE